MNHRSDKTVAHPVEPRQLQHCGKLQNKTDDEHTRRQQGYDKCLPHLRQNIEGIDLACYTYGFPLQLRIRNCHCQGRREN